MEKVCENLYTIWFFTSMVVDLREISEEKNKISLMAQLLIRKPSTAVTDFHRARISLECVMNVLLFLKIKNESYSGSNSLHA